MNGASSNGGGASEGRLSPNGGAASWESSELAQRLLRLEGDLRVRDREEQAARRDAARLSRQLEQREPGVHDHARWSEEQAERHTAEREAQRQRERADRAHAELEGVRGEAERARSQLQGLRDEAERAHAQLASLRAELDGTRRAGAELERELDAAQGELGGLRRALQNAEREQQRAAAEHKAQARKLQQTISALSVGLAHVKDDVQRAESSRAWRYGHRASSALARLAGRRARTDGALAAARARIERVQAATRGLPAPAGSSLAADASGASPAGSSPGVSGRGPLPAGSGLARALADSGGTAAGGTAAGGTAAGGTAAGGTAAGGHFAHAGSGAEARGGALPLSAADDARTAAQRASLAQRLRERFGPAPTSASWPLVSAIVPTRDGRAHLERLFEGLIEHTDYPALELVIVDNASSDDSLAYLRGLDPPFPLHVIESAENLSFAAANARGAERAGGELLLFLNNDVEAFEPGWLKELVCALDGDGVQAVGATLLHPEDLAREGDAPVLVQHRAVRFRWQDGMVKAYNAGDGDELWEGPLGSELRAPAVTAACMLIARESFERVGGFGTGYRYGTEDVDLGLKLLIRGGESAGVGRAVLVHRESSSQNRASRDFRRLNRLENRRLFLECWGPQVLREYRLARLRRDTFWTDGEGPHVAITLTSLDVRDGWGDWYSGHEIGDALEAQGWRVSYVQRKGEEWYELPHDLDYVLSLMDPFDLRRVPDHVTTIAWIRNWTERWLERPWFDRADVLLASSAGTAELIEASTGRQTIRFPLAVNPARFQPQPSQERYAVDYVFTGNWWGKDRDIQQALAPRADERVAVYGKDWEKTPELAPYARGEIPYTELPGVYASAKLVLDDTQGPTLPYGALNARVFDALAAGTLPLTNCESGVRELFDEEFPVWSSRETLRAQLDALLGDERRREELTRRYRETVLTRHTYAHRAAQLREILLAHEQRLSFCVKIGAPNREAAQRWGDLYFARALLAELRRRGHRGIVQTLDEWEQEDGLTYDVVVHLKGLSDYHPKPGQFNVLWSISHPEGLTGAECDGYDLVLVASPLFAEQLRLRTSTPVAVLEQAADAWVMRPGGAAADAEEAPELLYVANSRNVLRPIVRDLLGRTERDLAIWGSGWEGLIDAARVRGEHVPNGELGRLYGSAGIVLNDHWDDMRAHGYISNRIYDALACGAFVISDEVPGLAERFGDAVACYRSPQELHELVERFLDDPQERRRRGALGRELVLAGHTFAHRAEELLGLLEEHMQRAGHPARLRQQDGARAQADSAVPSSEVVAEPANVAEPSGAPAAPSAEPATLAPTGG